MESFVQDHYHSQNLTHRIQEALNAAGKNTKALAIKDLGPVDQLHTGGAPATLALMGKTGIAHTISQTQNFHILDAGCGIGGSSRLLAATFPCRVTGIDLSDTFIETAKELTCWCKLDKSTGFQAGSVLDMPFEENTFDAILCQHILMNIADKRTALKEFYRVLKPGASLILHEIFQGETSSIALPVPWAGDASISFLLTWEKFSPLLTDTGFRPGYFSDETHTALAWWQMVHAAGVNKKPRPLNPSLVFGANAAFFAVNMQHNFQNNSIQCIEAIYKKS